MGTDRERPVDLASALPNLLIDTEGGFAERDPKTFAASQIGFCPRQLYLSKLGLKDLSDVQGRFSTGRIVRDQLEQTINEGFPELEMTPSIKFDVGNVRFVGRCTAYDPRGDIVYHLRTRNGWYRFHPPVDRHIDQMHVYMRGLNASRGQIIYVSLNDFTDVRTWPPKNHDGAPYLEFDAGRFEGLVEKAKGIRGEIIKNGIATEPEEIPFQRCGCFFCEDEELDLLEASKSHPSTKEDPSKAFTPATQLSDEADPPPILNRESENINFGGVETHPTSITEFHVPEGLRDLRVWVVWDTRKKLALAPWQTQTMYPCEWAAEKENDPRRDYKKARIVSRMQVEDIHASWPFPSENNLPEQVKPAVLLPHDTHEPPLMFIDFDDVRDPDTGETSREVVNHLDRLSGYAEVSQSGTGIHVYVRANLPDSKQTIAPLNSVGTVELYTQARFTAGTWKHIKGTPLDRIPETQDAVNFLLETIR